MIEIEKDTFGNRSVDNSGNINYRSEDEIYSETKIKVSRTSNFSNTEDLLYDSLINLQEDWKIYFIYSESLPSKKSKIKSHKKLFYGLRKDSILKDSEIFETEIDVEDDKSLIASILSPKNNVSLKHIIYTQLDGRLRYILLVKKGKRSFKLNRSNHLKTMLTSRYKEMKTILINKEMLAKSLLNQFKFIISFMRGVNNRDVIEIIHKYDKTIEASDLSNTFSEFVATKLN